MYTEIKIFLAAALVFVSTVPGQATEDTSSIDESVVGIVDQLVKSISDPELSSLVAETLQRNPGVAAKMAMARAAAARAPRVKGLPDPVVEAIAWVKSPETRTGPQILTINLTQPLPWLGKFDLEEQTALIEASTLIAGAEASRLELVVSVRRLYYELAFLARHKAISQHLADHLREHEKISQARYSTGIGFSQDVVKIQAAISLAENLLLDIDRRRTVLEADLNALRDRPASAVVVPASLQPGQAVVLDYGLMVDEAQTRRPELVAANSRIAATEVRTKRAEKQYRPNFEVGMTYTFVDSRKDTLGRLMPPEGNGDDIFGVQGAITIPFWRKKLRAGVYEAGELELAAREEKRQVLAGITASIGDLVQRIPLTWQQLRLLEDILILQAEESVRSAQAGYVSGTLNALDLLAAEHVLFDAQTAVARAQADYAIQLAELEGAVAVPLEPDLSREASSP